MKYFADNCVIFRVKCLLNYEKATNQISYKPDTFVAIKQYFGGNYEKSKVNCGKIIF